MEPTGVRLVLSIDSTSVAVLERMGWRPFSGVGQVISLWVLNPEGRNRKRQRKRSGRRKSRRRLVIVGVPFHLFKPNCSTVLLHLGFSLEQC
jgi:hypothetical protein